MNVIVSGGIADLRSISTLEGKSSTTVAFLKQVSKANDHLIIGPVQQRNMVVYSQFIRNLPLEGDLFDAAMMAESQARAVPVEDETSKPPKFTTKSLWADWKRDFCNWLDMKPGFRPSTTLRYPTRLVHRNAQNEGYTEEEYRLTLQGTAYLEDNRKVAHYLQEAIRGHTTAYNHCSDKLQAQLGRQAFMALVSQYEGAGNVINQISAAEKARTRRDLVLMTISFRPGNMQ